MDLILEFMEEFIFEISIDIIKNKKITKFIRYPLLIIILSLYFILIFGLLVISLKLIEKNILIAIFIILISILFIILFIEFIKKLFK